MNWKYERQQTRDVTRSAFEV